MDLSTLFTSLQNTLGAQLPPIFVALAILIVGWLVAVSLRAGTRRLLGMLKVDARIEESTGQKVSVESGIAIGVFWLVILVTVVAVFNSLHLDRISNPFAQLVGADHRLRAAPGRGHDAGAGRLGDRDGDPRRWSTARSPRASWASTLSKEAGMEPMSKTVANVLFWLVILLFVPSILGAPSTCAACSSRCRACSSKLLDMVPNVFGAAVIGFVGWLVAKVLRGPGHQPARGRGRGQDGQPDRPRRRGQAVAPRRHHRLHPGVRADADRGAGRAQDRGDLASPPPKCWSGCSRRCRTWSRRR